MYSHWESQWYMPFAPEMWPSVINRCSKDARSNYNLPPGPERKVIETQLGYRWNQFIDFYKREWPKKPRLLFLNHAPKFKDNFSWNYLNLRRTWFPPSKGYWAPCLNFAKTDILRAHEPSNYRILNNLL
jgi:hypothetical protein